MNYVIKKGTVTIKEFDNLDGMLRYWRTMGPMDRFSSKLYNYADGLVAEGWKYNSYERYAWRHIRGTWKQERGARTVTVRWATEAEMRTRTADPANGIVDIILVPCGGQTLEMLRWEQH